MTPWYLSSIRHKTKMMNQNSPSYMALVVIVHLIYCGFTYGMVKSGDLTIREPEFTGPIRNVTIPLGREAVLSCSIENLGEYKVGWLRADDQTILSLHRRVVTHNPRVIVTHDESKTWNLHIRQVKESDQGCYMCQINTATMRKQLGCIQVQVPPDILDENTTSDVTVTEGDNVTLTCKAKGKPSPRIFWRREDGERILLNKPTHHGGNEADAQEIASHRNSNQRISAQQFVRGDHQNRDRNRGVEVFHGEVLRMFRVTRRMMGAYTCIATNDVPPAVSKRVSLNVNFVPLVRAETQLMGAPPGSQVKLECNVESYPQSINYWLKGRPEENNMLLQSRKYDMGDERNGYHGVMSLVIRDFSADDEGTYTCVATNSLGKAEGTVRLYEIKNHTPKPQTSTQLELHSTERFNAKKFGAMDDVSKRETSTASSLTMKNQQNRNAGSHTYYPDNNRNLQPTGHNSADRKGNDVFLVLFSVAVVLLTVHA